MLLGDRYGWVPPPERMAGAVEERGYVTDVAGKSVTALEVEFGVLDNTDQAARGFFYFRDPLPYDQMSAEQAALYSDAHDPHPSIPDAPQRLAALKARIEPRPSALPRWDWMRKGRVLRGWGRDSSPHRSIARVRH